MPTAAGNRSLADLAGDGDSGGGDGSGGGCGGRVVCGGEEDAVRRWGYPSLALHSFRIAWQTNKIVTC